MKVSPMISGIASHLIQNKEMSPLKEKDRGQSKPGGATDNRGDRVSLSSGSRDLMEIRNASGPTTSSADDLKSERIERLRYQIRSGTYTPDPERIAKAMLSVHKDSMI